MNVVAKQNVAEANLCESKSNENHENQPTLVLVENSKQVALTQIREMLNNKQRNPAHIFDTVLNSKERKVLCFSAGLSRSDLTKKFNELPEDARIAIKNAILLCGNIFKSFNDAQALEMKKFIAQT